MTKKRERPTDAKAAVAPKDASKSNTDKASPKKRGWDEIESLFDKKKDVKEEQRLEKNKQEKADDERRKRRKAQRVASATNSNGVFSKTESWVDDGLGGKYNPEGFTGRTEDGVKVFKAHLLSKPGAGSTSQCPFDCECCYM